MEGKKGNVFKKVSERFKVLEDSQKRLIVVVSVILILLIAITIITSITFAGLVGSAGKVAGNLNNKGFAVAKGNKVYLSNSGIKDEKESFENEEEIFETNTSKIKNISVSKENFENILGLDGKIEIYNENNELVSTISKDNYSVDVDINEATIKTTKPVKEGILVINTKKEITNTEYSYEQIKTFSNLNINYIGSYILSQGVEKQYWKCRS